MKNIAILGSTGSVGSKALDVVRRFKDKLRVVSLSAGSNWRLLLRQAKEFHPDSIAVFDESKERFLRAGLKGLNVKVYAGPEGLIEQVKDRSVDLALIATAGRGGLSPALQAIESGKDIALATKEVMVMAGGLVTGKARAKGVRIIPVDSEHNAIFQCLSGNRRRPVKRLILTASGGPFLNFTVKKLEDVTPEGALCHPRWKMGKKITIDSATLMNKGLEVIEAHWFFGVDVEKIETLIHPEAIIHSMVEFIDGSILAQMGRTDMHLPLQFALSYPDCWASRLPGLDFPGLRRLTFKKPPFNKFPCLSLALESARQGGSTPVVLNAVNDTAVNAFLRRKIRFTDIGRLVENALQRHKKIEHPDLKTILAIDEEYRNLAILRKL